MTFDKTAAPEIQETVMIFHEMTPEEQAEEIERMKEKTLRDEKSLFMTGFNEGYKLGREEARKRMLAAMREIGISEEQIREYIEMSENE